MSDPSDARRVLGRWALIAVGVAVFSAAAFGARTGGMFFDRPIIALVHSSQRPLVTSIAERVTWLGSGGVLATVAVASTLFLFALRTPWQALFVGTIGAGAGGLNELLKLAFARPRPDPALRLAVASGYSFPSGHAMASAAILGALGLVLAQRHPRHRVAIGTAAVLLVVLIGASRVYLCVHYPSDVLGGWLAGTAMALFLAPLFLRRPGAQPLRDAREREP